MLNVTGNIPVKTLDRFSDLYEFIRVIERSYNRSVEIWADTITHKRYVVKTIDNRDKFFHEMTIHKMVTGHTSISYFHEAYIDDLDYYLVIEYIEGSKLGQIIDLDNVWKLLQTIISVLLYLHGKKILHGDLKPDNIMKTAQGEYKIIDFGLSMYSRSSGCAGTPLYMAPEYMRTYNETDGDMRFEEYDKTDVWSLGVILYELTHLHHPYKPTSCSSLKKQCEEATLVVSKSSLDRDYFLLIDPSKEDLQKISILNEIIDGCLTFKRKQRISLHQIREKIETVNVR